MSRALIYYAYAYIERCSAFDLRELPNESDILLEYFKGVCGLSRTSNGLGYEMDTKVCIYISTLVKHEA